LALEYALGFFALERRAGRKIPLATWTWDCGRWGWLGHVGHGIGWLSQSLDRGVPALAIHPSEGVTRLLAASFTSALRRPLAFHLGQAGLSFRYFREIARLLRGRVPSSR
jgi:hypothetical protein